MATVVGGQAWAVYSRRLDKRMFTKLTNYNYPLLISYDLVIFSIPPPNIWAHVSFSSDSICQLL